MLDFMSTFSHQMRLPYKRNHGTWLKRVRTRIGFVRILPVRRTVDSARNSPACLCSFSRRSVDVTFLDSLAQAAGAFPAPPAPPGRGVFGGTPLSLGASGLAGGHG